MKPLRFTFVALASLLFGAALWSCSSNNTPIEPAETRSAPEQQSPPTMASAGGGTMDQLGAGCPMVVQGADVTVTDTEGGVALTFTTDTGDVADLRARVQQMAQMYEMHHGQAGMMWHHVSGQGTGGHAMGGHGMGGHGMGGHGTGHMPAASTTMTDTDLGARLELRPSDASQLGALREHVRWHQQRMYSGECWRLQGQPTATPRE